MTSTITQWVCDRCGARDPDHTMAHPGPDGPCHGEPMQRTYVAVDALLSDATIAAVARAQYAAEREIPVDPEMYANALVRDEYTKFAGIGLRAAVAALSETEERDA